MEEQPEYKIDVETYQPKVLVAEAIGMPYNSFRKFINNGWLYDKLVSETRYNKNQKNLYPIQMKLIEREYGGLTK